jgi:cytidine deaminase
MKHTSDSPQLSPASEPLRRERPELYIGLIGAVGAQMRRVNDLLTKILARVGYGAREIHVIERLAQLEGWEAKPPASGSSSPPDAAAVEKYYHALMDAGNRFRSKLQSKAAMAFLAMRAIQEDRNVGDGTTKTAFIIRSLKTPEEVALLRETYGKSFIAVGAYASKDSRRRFLRDRILHASNGNSAVDPDALAAAVLHRDDEEPEGVFGRNVEATFPLADFFVEADGETEALERSLSRIVELLFGNLFHAPTRDEYGMFHAVTAGVRSSSPARQVGASICTAEGELIALGCNDVPKAGGGLYWEGDEGDARDHLRGYDFNDQMKTLFLRDILARLQQSGWLDPSLEKCATGELLDRAMSPGSSLRQSELMKVIEYGRSVHAEMAALMDAAKRGIAVEGCTLYTTTFPCHNCAKHIVASGLKRVVYVEPYPKSYTKQLYSDSVCIDGEGGTGDAAKAVRFEPFVGISYRQYFSLFSTGGVDRKINGSLTQWTPESAAPRFYEHHSACLAREREVLARFDQCLRGGADR